MPFCETQPGRGSGLTGPSPARVFKEATLAARKAGDKAEARRQLLALTERDDRNELAWLWLAGVAESSDEALEWLGRVLEINPSNERAKASLEWHLARSAPQAPGQECPVCSLQFARPERRCSVCQARLTLDRPEEFFGGKLVDDAFVTDALGRAEARVRRRPEYQAHSPDSLFVRVPLSILAGGVV